MTRPTEWLSKWIYILTASLYFIAVILRTWLFFNNRPQLEGALGLLLLWLLLLASEPVVSSRWSSYFPLYLIIQTILVFILMTLPGTPDFMAALLAVLSMQTMLRLPTRIGSLWIVLCAVIMGLLLAPTYEYQAIALALIYTAGNVFLGAYTRTIRRAQATRLHIQALANELEQANRRLQEYSTQMGLVAAARERNRLARTLHDSVTQTVFSMNLTSQSALLLLERDPSRVSEQLARLYALARNALGEMQVLIDELKPDPAGQKGLPDALQQLLASRRFSDSLSVSIEVTGNRPLLPPEQQGLFNIAQEALNNVVKHAQVSQAQIRLHLQEPFWMEIEDHGQGFDPQQAQPSGSLGMASMSERATEINWKLQVVSYPGSGTRIRVEKPRLKEGEDGNSRV